MECNGIQMNGFNFIVVWIVKDRKEMNGNNSCSDREKKIKEKNLI